MVFKVTDKLNGCGSRFCNNMHDFNFDCCQSHTDIVYQNIKAHCALKKLQQRGMFII